MALTVLAWCGALADVIERSGIRVEYPPRHATTAQDSLRTLLAAREELRARLPNDPPTITVVLCGDYDTFGQYAGPFSMYSVLGVAKPDEDIIAIKTPNIAPAGSDYAGTLRHELIHILLRHNIETDRLPRWLNEGIAMVYSGENRWASRSKVASMYLAGRIRSYRDLEASFLDPGQELEFGDAYAQAYSMTQYLRNELGDDRFWALLRSLDSRSFGQALEAELGLIPHDFVETWKGSLGWLALGFSVISGITVFQLAALLTVLAYWRRRRRKRELYAQWEEEEEVAEEPEKN